MSQIARTFTFSDGTTAFGSQVEVELGTIFTAWNAHDAGNSTWTVTSSSLFKMADGTVGAPSQAFAADPDTGFYRIGANNFAATAGGVKVLDILAGAINALGAAEQNLYVTSTGGPQFRIYASLSNATVYLMTNNNYSMTFSINNTLTPLMLDLNGNVIVGSAALITTATNGFFYIPSCPGAPTGVPTSVAGRLPMIYDGTNNKFYIYNGGWKGVVLS